MANTTNLNLAKPAGTDKALVSVLNSNSDKIDAFAGSTNQAISNIRQNEIVIPITENTNLNTLTTPGYYNLYGAKSLVNAPVSGANRLGLIVQRAESTQYVYQMALDNVNDATGVYVRSCKGGTWSAWQQLALKSDIFISGTIGSRLALLDATGDSYTIPATGMYKLSFSGTGGQIKMNGSVLFDNNIAVQFVAPFKQGASLSWAKAGGTCAIYRVE
jgi:hypothetical protein